MKKYIVEVRYIEYSLGIRAYAVEANNPQEAMDDFRKGDILRSQQNIDFKNEKAIYTHIAGEIETVYNEKEGVKDFDDALKELYHTVDIDISG